MLLDPLLRLASGPVSTLLRADALDEGRLPAEPRFVPRARRYAWTHYGVMIPDLPEPHRFLACMSLIGATGSRIFDTDHARVDSPRNTATLVNGTAVTAPDHFRAYSIPRDCEFAPDGSLVRFGDDLLITGLHPHFRVEGRRDDLRFALDLVCSDAVTYFVRGPVWTHLSILCSYTGEVDGIDVEGTCTFEYGACALSPHTLLDVPIPSPLKLDGDRFNYNVLALGPGRQLLLSQIGFAGGTVVGAAYERRVTGETSRITRGVSCAVVEHDPSPAVAPDGREMPLPRRLRWTGPDLEVEATIDSPWIYGLGSGYVTGYAFSGRLEDEAISGRGYLEYIDRRGR